MRSRISPSLQIPPARHPDARATQAGCCPPSHDAELDCDGDGVPTLREIFEDKYYTDLPGGILEGLGRLFQGNVKLSKSDQGNRHGRSGHGRLSGRATTTTQPLRHMLENGSIEAIQEFDAVQLHITPREVLAKLQSNDASWQAMVPPEVARLIQERGLFLNSTRADG